MLARHCSEHVRSRLSSVKGSRVGLAFVVCLAAAACASQPAAPAQTVSAVVSRVGDGDTLDLENGERVRLLQIDAPELGEGECYALEARSELRRLLPRGAGVRLERDPGADDRDRFGRLLRYVRSSDSLNVNVELVRRGAAAPYFRGGEHGSYADDLLAAVEEARDAGRGMWGACVVDWRENRQVETR